MPYDLDLSERIRREFRERRDVVEKKMFGGLAFLVAGHLCAAIWHDQLIARIGPDAYEAALELPHVTEFDVTGRPMRGWVMIDPEGLDSPEALSKWIQQCVAFAESLPER